METVIWLLLIFGLWLLGTAGTVFVLSFTEFGKRTVGHWYEKDLKRLQDQLDTQRALISDRGVRFNEREYAALISAWEGYVRAHLATGLALNAFTSHPDLERMTEETRREYLKSAGVPDRPIQLINEHKSPNQAYTRFIRMTRLNDANTAISDAFMVVRNQGIFITKDLESDFNSAIQVMSDAHIWETINFEDGSSGPQDREKQKVFRSVGETNYNGLKDAIRHRLGLVLEL